MGSNNLKNAEMVELASNKDEMYKLLKKFSLTDVAEIVHKLTGNKKNKVYKWLLDIQKK